MVIRKACVRGLGWHFPHHWLLQSLEQRAAELCALHTQHPQAASNIPCVLSLVGCVTKVCSATGAWVLLLCSSISGSYSALFRILSLSVLLPRELLKGQGAWPKWTLLQISIFMIFLLAEKQVFDKISWLWMFNREKDGIISKPQNSWFYQ